MTLKLSQAYLFEHPDLLVDLQQFMEPLHFPKHHLLHHEHTVCYHAFFIEKGGVRVFHHKEGKDITSHFAFEMESVTAVDSMLRGDKSMYNIELLEESWLHAVTYEDMEKFFQMSIRHERLGRLFMQEAYVELVERIEDIQFHSAQERYDALLKKRPYLLQRVPLKHISSYLGITQETLSRIRGQ